MKNSIQRKIKPLEDEICEKGLAIIDFIGEGESISKRIKTPLDLFNQQKSIEEHTAKLREMTEERNVLSRKLRTIRVTELIDLIDKYNRGTSAWNLLSFSSLDKKQLRELGKLLNKDDFKIDFKDVQSKISEELSRELDVLQQVIESKQKTLSPSNILTHE